MTFAWAVPPVIANISPTAYPVPPAVGAAARVTIAPAPPTVPKVSIIMYLVVASGVND